MDEESVPAGIEYHGIAGTTEPCVKAIERLLHAREPITNGRILTCHEQERSTSHAMLLTNVVGDEIIIKSGFSSGYWGGGPAGLSRAIGLLDWFGVELDEIEIDAACMERLDLSALTTGDMQRIRTARPIRPTRLWDYVADQDYVRGSQKNPWLRSEPVIPLAIIDDRLSEIARTFWADPDAALSKGYRRLETILRERTNLDIEEAAKLGPAKIFGRAFNGEQAALTWDGTVAAEREGRANIFVGAAKAYRNRRAHREPPDRADEQLMELLLLNHLYRLESEASPAPGQSS